MDATLTTGNIDTSAVQGVFEQLTGKLPLIIAIAVGALLLCNLLYAILAAAMAAKKGFNRKGYFFLALFFGFLGFLHVVGLPCYHDSLRAKKARKKAKRYGDDE